MFDMGERFGQHFLKSDKTLSEIAGLASITKNDVVIEIGAGTGTLTKKLTKAKKVYAVEIDRRLFPKLLDEMKKYPNVECINKDVLDYDFPKDVNKVIGNLPYEISSPITEKILKFLNKQENSGKKTLAVLMYQLEFAERMTSFPGLKDYSRLSVLVNYYAEAKIAKKISKSAFRPAPRVESAVVLLKPIGTKENPELFKTTKIMFMHKNKNVVNALTDSRSFLKIKDKKKLREILPKLLGGLGEKKIFYLEIEELEKITNILIKGKILGE